MTAATDATGARELSFLDVAGGSGDIAHALQVKLEQTRLRVRTVVLDRSWAHLKMLGENSSRAVVAEACSLPFADDSFDVVGSSLFVHHLPPELRDILRHTSAARSEICPQFLYRMAAIAWKRPPGVAV